MNKEFLEKANACTTMEELQKLIKNEAQGFTVEEIRSLVQSCSEKIAAANENSELTDKELSEVSGGASTVSLEPGRCTVYTFLTEAENSTKEPDELDVQIYTELVNKHCRNCVSAFLCKCPVGKAAVLSNYIYGVTKFLK